MPTKTDSSLHIGEQYLAEHPELEMLELIMPDINGVARGKWAKPESIIKAFQQKLRFPVSAYAGDIWGEGAANSGLVLAAGDQDGIAVPIASSLKPITWYTRPAAQIMLGLTREDGTPFFGDPRYVLQKVLDRFSKLQLTPVIALEMEFYLFDKNKLKNNVPVSHRFDNNTNLYDLGELHDNEPVIIEIQNALAALDIPADTFVNENAPGQFEINLSHHKDAMLAADQAFLFKRTIKACAKKYGKVASFMAKPLPNFPGNGMHMHMSLLDAEGNNQFTKQDDQPGKAFGFGIAGILDTLPDTLAFLAPHANSYRRLNGSGLAPTTLSWGWENRTSALRLPLADDTNQRIEHRVGSADANPYLVIAAILAGVHHGLTNKPELPEATYGNAYAQHEAVLSMSWEQAVKRCIESDFIKEYFGTEFVQLFGAIKAQEIKRFQETINDFEYFSYLKNS